MNKNKPTKSNQKDQRLIDAKISLLQLAEELGNIQKACKAAEIARSSFYEIICTSYDLIWQLPVYVTF